MGGVFDRLHSQIGVEEEEGGLSVLDLAALPPAWRRLMRLMLREGEMTHAEICEAVEAMSEAERLSRAELEEALDLLSKNLWLIRMGEERITYRPNLRRKAGSKLAQSIWASLESRIGPSQPSAPEEPDES
jgi:hypothetical protein